MSKKAMKQALETIEKSWKEDRVRSDLLPAIQTMRQALEQPAAQWVGLTDEEVEALASWWPSYDQMPALKVLIKDVINSLKEKNT